MYPPGRQSWVRLENVTFPLPPVCTKAARGAKFDSVLSYSSSCCCSERPTKLLSWLRSFYCWCPTLQINHFGSVLLLLLLMIPLLLVPVLLQCFGSPEQSQLCRTMQFLISAAALQPTWMPALRLVQSYTISSAGPATPERSCQAKKKRKDDERGKKYQSSDYQLLVYNVYKDSQFKRRRKC